MIHVFPMPRAYSYTRFSTPEQAGGDSARRQMEAARTYAATHGLELDDLLSISDLGVSAYTGANLDPEAGLGRFVEAVERGLVYSVEFSETLETDSWDAGSMPLTDGTAPFAPPVDGFLLRTVSWSAAVPKQFAREKVTLAE